MNTPVPSGVVSCCRITDDKSDRERFISLFGLSFSEPLPLEVTLTPDEPTVPPTDGDFPCASGYLRYFIPDAGIIDDVDELPVRCCDSLRPSQSTLRAMRRMLGLFGACSSRW